MTRGETWSMHGPTKTEERVLGEGWRRRSGVRLLGVWASTETTRASRCTGVVCIYMYEDSLLYLFGAYLYIEGTEGGTGASMGCWGWRSGMEGRADGRWDSVWLCVEGYQRTRPSPVQRRDETSRPSHSRLPLYLYAMT